MPTVAMTPRGTATPIATFSPGDKEEVGGGEDEDGEVAGRGDDVEEGEEVRNEV